MMGYHLNFELLWKHIKSGPPTGPPGEGETNESFSTLMLWSRIPAPPHLIPILLLFSSFLIISWFSSLLVIAALIRDITRAVRRPQMKDELMDAQLPRLFDGWFSN